MVGGGGAFSNVARNMDIRSIDGYVVQVKAAILSRSGGLL